MLEFANGSGEGGQAGRSPLEAEKQMQMEFLEVLDSKFRRAKAKNLTKLDWSAISMI
jgi:hypothetical protein